MLNRFTIFCFFASTSALCGAGFFLQANDTIVKGRAYMLNPGGVYAPFEKVHVWAVRKSFVPGTLVDTDKTGYFEVKVPGPEPFTLMFNGANKVPELQLLAGVGVSELSPNFIKVALLTAEQHLKLAPNDEYLTHKKAGIDTVLAFAANLFSEAEKKPFGLTVMEIEKMKAMKVGMKIIQ